MLFNQRGRRSNRCSPYYTPQIIDNHRSKCLDYGDRKQYRPVRHHDHQYLLDSDRATQEDIPTNLSDEGRKRLRDFNSPLVYPSARCCRPSHLYCCTSPRSSLMEEQFRLKGEDARTTPTPHSRCFRSFASPTSAQRWADVFSRSCSSSSLHEQRKQNHVPSPMLTERPSSTHQTRPSDERRIKGIRSSTSSACHTDTSCAPVVVCPGNPMRSDSASGMTLIENADNTHLPTTQHSTNLFHIWLNFGPELYRLLHESSERPGSSQYLIVSDQMHMQLSRLFQDLNQQHEGISRSEEREEKVIHCFVALHSDALYYTKQSYFICSYIFSSSSRFFQSSFL